MSLHYKQTKAVALTVIFSCLAFYQAFAQCNVIIDQDFNHWSNKRYTVADAKNDFNNKVKPWTASTYRGISGPGASSNLIGDVKQETRIVDGQLRAEYTKNDAGGYAGGFLFDPYFDAVDEAYLEYKVKFDDNFFWATGGKLPGLGGSTSGINSETSGRGSIPSGCKYNTNGWSARLMWRRNRAQTTQPYLILYSYFAEKQDGGMRQDGDCGDAKRIYTGLKDNTWYTIRQYIKMNTPGQRNGVVVMWINGNEVYRDEKAFIRHSGKNNLKINALIMNTYRGGSRTDPVWHSPRDEYAFFDDFKVWTGCNNPSDDPEPNKNPNVSITSPSNGTTFELGQTINWTANASDPEGRLDRVNFKLNGGYYSMDNNAPFTASFTPTEAGEYTLGARAFDQDGGSREVSIKVTVEENTSGHRLYTQTGTDPTWSYILNNNLIPIGRNSTAGVKGSDINVHNNLVEVGPYADLSIDQEISIHTVGNSVIRRNDFQKWSRWYQEDGNTQVFRLFKGEENVRNSRSAAARTEAFNTAVKWKEGAWHEWVGTYTFIKPIGCAIFQAKNNVNDWSVQLNMTSEGHVVLNRRRGEDVTIARNMVEKPFHIKVRDNGLKYEVYLNGEFVGGGEWARPEGETSFRWGMYCGASIPANDAMIFVTGATVDPEGVEEPVNQDPNVSITSPSNGTTFELGQTINWTANASDPEGRLDRVNFKLNGGYYSMDKTAPFAASFTPTQAGEYTLGARAFDADGGSKEVSIKVTVNENLPKDCAGIPGGTAKIDACGVCAGGTTGKQPSSPKTWYKDSDGDGVGVTGNTIQSCDKPVGYASVGGDLCPADGNKTAPGECGCGVAESTCVTEVPIVSFITPLNGYMGKEGDNITVVVDAADPDGTVEKVELYLNGYKIREERRAPYEWNHEGYSDPLLDNMAPGVYNLAAIATDNEGNTASQAIVIVIEKEVDNEPTGPIVGDNCAVKNGEASFELTNEYRDGVTGYSWWFSGAATTVSQSQNTPYKVTMTFDQYYKGGEVCVGVNLNKSPYYTSYCKPVGVCATQKSAAFIIDANIYPNPIASDVLTIEPSADAGQLLQVRIVDKVGQDVYHSSNISSGHVNISTIAPGVYTILIVTENGSISKVLTVL